MDKYTNTIEAVNALYLSIINNIQKGGELLKEGKAVECVNVLNEANSLIDRMNVLNTTTFYKEILDLKTKAIDSLPKTYKLIIEREDDSYYMDPREWDNIGTMICWHRNYRLGDNHNFENPYNLMEALARKTNEGEYYILNDEWYEGELSEGEYIEKLRMIAEKQYLILPIYMYEHSDISLSTGDFGCEWDSGQVGFIYASYEKISKECGIKEGENIQEVGEKYLKDEVKIYDSWIRGEVYRVIIKEYDYEGDYIGDYADCGGFIGDDIYENGIADHWDFEKLGIELYSKWAFNYEEEYDDEYDDEY